MKKIRRIYQTLFFILSIYVFYGGYSLIEWPVRLYHSLHIFPALSLLLTHSFNRYMALCLILVVSAAFAGRFYCSFLCPMGFLQDLFDKAGKKLKISSNKTVNYPIIRYFILFFTLFLTLSGSSAWGWIDHFSNFGRMIVSCVWPAVNILLSPFAGYLNRTSDFQIEGLLVTVGFDFYYSLLFMIFLIAVSLFRPRWFCNTLCPSGTIFSLVSSAGFLKIKLDDSCTKCEKCEKICPSGSITVGNVDYSTCIGCFECVGACTFHSLKLSFEKPFGAKGAALKMPVSEFSDGGESRRTFIKRSAGVIAGIFAAGYSSRLIAAGINPKKINSVIPPGASNAQNFFSKCSACHMCISNCPTKVIVAAGFENGFAGLSKPKLDFSRSHCAYECNICTGVCPSGALKYLPLPLKQVTAIGLVTLDSSDKTECIPYKQKTDCGACAEHCPTGAVYMQKHGDVFVPRIRKRYCIGCGICENVCPVSSNKPIVVSPLAKHIKIFKLSDEEVKKNISPAPRVMKNGETKSGGNDFPF